MVETDHMARTSQYICAISPLIDIQLPQNDSFIINLAFQPQLNHSNPVTNTTEYFAFFEHKSKTKAYLTLLIESESYHKSLFYMKCLMTPLVLSALVWFSVRLYMHDLYISIPDRLLIASAIAQILFNIPAEVIVMKWDEPYLKLIDEIGCIGLQGCLLLFWVVYTKDKLAKNEAWERNTRYYWKHILLVTLSCLVAALFVIYNRGPTFSNAFRNHWTETNTIFTSLGFIFGLVVVAMIYQMYLSILICKLLCDVTVEYQHLSLRMNWRIKMILLYNLLTSLLTVGGFVLQQAVRLGLNWNQQFFVDPVPMHLVMAGPYYVGLQGNVNELMLVNIYLNYQAFLRESLIIQLPL